MHIQPAHGICLPTNLVNLVTFAALLMLPHMARAAENAASPPPVRVAIVGLVHDHAFGFIPQLKQANGVQLVGIVETNRGLIEAYSNGVQLETNLFFNSLDDLMRSNTVDAAAVFTTTFGHKEAVEMLAGRGVKTIMLEKPLAVNMEHARAIAATSRRSGAEVFINYETTWYPANRELRKLALEQKALGPIRKIVTHHGHRGPQEIGCTEDFLKWLTDPVLNGGGALTDMGAYGAVLMTWLMEGKRPTSVSAVAQQIKPSVYPKVEDEATIVVTYPEAQGIIQASWNWPYDRKDAEVYGRTGYAIALNNTTVRSRFRSPQEKQTNAPPLLAPDTDAVSYLAAIARREIKPAGMSSLENNLVVTEILDAARRSAQTGRRIDLTETR